MTKILCPYCQKYFDYSKDEISWMPVLRKMMPSSNSDKVQELYTVSCKNPKCGKAIEFWM